MFNMNNYREKINRIEDKLASNTSISDNDKAELLELIDRANSSIDEVEEHNKFLQSKFDDVSFSIPEDDHKYYKGVLVNNLKVYLAEFDTERRKRDIAKLKEMAFVAVNTFGLLITIMGVLTCLFAILYRIFV